MYRAIAAAALIALAAPSAVAFAAAEPPPPRATGAQAAIERAELLKKYQAFEAGLHKRSGRISLNKPKVTLDLGNDYVWLDNADSKRVLVDLWGNPPQAAEDVYGMIMPADMVTYGDDTWAAVVTYEDTGYVPDKDARTTDYGKLLDEMRKGEEEVNPERTKAGFQAVHTIGWAQSPSYDANRHALIWARNLKFEGQDGNTLNYDVRVLGRRGVLSMNIVSDMGQLDVVRSAGATLQGTASFETGERYADYKKGDKKAAYGIGGLILAGAGLAAAKKAGLIAVGLIFLKKGWIVLLAVFGGGWRWLQSRFARKPKTLELQSPSETSKDDGPGGTPWS